MCARSPLGRGSTHADRTSPPPVEHPPNGMNADGWAPGCSSGLVRPVRGKHSRMPPAVLATAVLAIATRPPAGAPRPPRVLGDHDLRVCVVLGALGLAAI